jgi:hypothetical protein
VPGSRSIHHLGAVQIRAHRVPRSLRLRSDLFDECSERGISACNRLTIDDNEAFTPRITPRRRQFNEIGPMSLRA